MSQNKHTKGGQPPKITVNNLSEPKTPSPATTRPGPSQAIVIPQDRLPKNLVIPDTSAADQTFPIVRTGDPAGTDPGITRARNTLWAKWRTWNFSSQLIASDSVNALDADLQNWKSLKSDLERARKLID